jgi:predicted DNA-binding protein
LPRTGRPPSSDPKRHDTRIRMSDEDVELLEYCCKATGKTKAEVIREGIRKVYDEVKA